MGDGESVRHFRVVVESGYALFTMHNEATS